VYGGNNGGVQLRVLGLQGGNQRLLISNSRLVPVSRRSPP
jgi:hypothetical protein